MYKEHCFDVARKFPKIIGSRKSKALYRKALSSLSYVRREKTKRERVYDVIYDACIYGYHFADPYYGMPLIEPNEVEEQENGIYVIRFRCEPQYLRKVYFNRMASDVCNRLRSGLHFIHKAKREWGIPYEECVWVIQIGEEDRDIPIWRKIFMAETKIDAIGKKERPHPRKCTHQRWDEFLQTHYNRTLLSVAKELGYSEQNLDILGGDFTNIGEKKRIYKKHKKLFDDFLADERNKGLMDGRQVYEYFKDLISGWIGEDLLIKALNEYGFTASLSNADSDRVIKTNYVGVTSEPDIKIEYEGNIRYLELMEALTPVESYGQFDMRLSKAKNQFNRKNLFLLHGLADGKYLLIDFMRENITLTCNYPNPRFGNKPCSVVNFAENGIKMQDIALFWESLKDVMLNTSPEPHVHYLKMKDYISGMVETMGRTEDDLSSDDSIGDSSDSESDRNANIQPPKEPDECRDESDSSSDELKVQEKSEQDGREEVTEEYDETLSTDTSIESSDESVIEEGEDGQSIEYTAEQWAALNEGF